MMELIVSEIFYSIQGETLTSGLTSVFVRLTGCNLDCAYCDTRYARDGGKIMTLDRIIESVTAAGPCDHYTVTGGEPLCQEAAPELMRRLVSLERPVQLETNGSLALRRVPAGVRKIVDVKTPSSGHAGSFAMENIPLLNQHDEVKFIVADDEDFRFAREFINGPLASSSALINLSPAYGSMEPARLAGLIISNRLRVRLNLQLHKIIWGTEEESKVVIK